MEGGGGMRLWGGGYTRQEEMGWTEGREDSRRQSRPRWMGEWNDGTIFFFLEGLTVKVISVLLVDELGGTEHLSLGAKGDSGTGSRGVARPSRLAATSASMHHPPGRPWCLPAPGPRQGSVHGLRQGATVQGSSCGPPAHSGTMERHVGVSWREMGGLGTGRLEKQLQGGGWGGGALGAPREVLDPPRP